MTNNDTFSEDLTAPDPSTMQADFKNARLYKID
jgi:hypothetical protein